MAELSTIARPYAVAVFKLAKEKSTLSTWSDMLSFASAVASDERMQSLIADPKLTNEELAGAFLSVCDGKLNEQGKNLIQLLVEYGRLSIMPEIYQQFEALKASDEGELEAQIVTAAAVNQQQIDVLVQRLEVKFGKKVNAQVQVDPSIIGGVKVIIGDTVIDASVHGQLQNLAYTLSA